MEKQKRSKPGDQFAQKRPLLLNQREPKIVGANRLQVVLPCPVPPLSCRVAQSSSSLRGFSQLSHKEMIQSLLSSESFPGLRQHAAALLSSGTENESLDLVFNDPLGLEVDLFHPHSLYNSEPTHGNISTNGTSYSQNGDHPPREEDASSLPLEDLFLVNPQLYFDFVAEREKEAKMLEEQKQQNQFKSPTARMKPNDIPKQIPEFESQQADKEISQFEEVQKFKPGFTDNEGRQILQVSELLPQIKQDFELSHAIANLEVKASELRQPGSHIFTFQELNAGETKKPTRFQSFTQMEDEQAARFKEEASILALIKKSEDQQAPLALVGIQTEEGFITQPIFDRFKTSTIEKLTGLGERLLLVGGEEAERMEELGRKEFEIKEEEKKEEVKQDQGQDDYLSDDIGLAAMLHGGPMVEQAPLQSEDEQGF